MLLDDLSQALAACRMGVIDRLGIQKADDFAAAEKIPGLQQMLVAIGEWRVHDNRVVVANPVIGKPVEAHDREILAGQYAHEFGRLLDAVHRAVVVVAAIF